MTPNSTTTRMVFFNEGDHVRLTIPGSPVMMVRRIVKNPDAKNSRDRLQGIHCVWFENGTMKEDTFNTKDLEKLDKVGRVMEISGHTWGREAE